MSQEVLAEQLGVERSTVHRWESGKREPQPWHRPNLATALKISVEELDDLLSDKPKRHALTPVGLTLPFLQTSEPVDDLAVMDAFRLADRQAGGGQRYATMTSYLQTTVAPWLVHGNENALRDS